jgi:hypothetical protein
MNMPVHDNPSLFELSWQYRYNISVITRVKITLADIILIISALVISGIWFFSMFVQAEPGAVVEIHNSTGLYQVIGLDEDATISVPGPLGDSVLRIKGGKVSMVSSPCPTKVCINTGEIRYAGEGIVCIPNKVYAVIRGGKREPDAITY